MPSLDRFAVGLPDPQDEQPVAKCEVCRDEIYAGDKVYYTPEGAILCSSHECVVRHYNVEEMYITDVPGVA